MVKKTIEISIYGAEGRIGHVQGQLPDAALAEIAKLVNKHLKTDALNVKSAADDKQPTK